MSTDFMTVVTSVQLAGLTTLILLFIGTPLAWWLARSSSLLASCCIPLIALPLVLPPTV
ncbi:MAG: molybdate ABC transporter permease subunit, partial [Pseudomonadales bacterium]|nr:molybdate ABC transporter permease subunit [Pseudomonadales bacterium]